MLKRLELRNFQKHEHFEHDFGPGLTLCVGNNWQGKSTLIRGIIYALFGSSAVPVRTDNLVTHGHKTMEAQLSFVAGEAEYLVKRGQTKAELYSNGTLIASGQGPTTAKIEDLIGDAKNFLAYQTVRQGEAAGLLTLGATKLAQHINAVTGVDVVDRVLERVRDEKLLLKHQLDGLERLRQQQVDMTREQIQLKLDLAEQQVALQEATQQEERLRRLRNVSRQQWEEAKYAYEKYQLYVRAEQDRQQKLTSSTAAIAAAERLLAETPDVDPSGAYQALSSLAWGFREGNRLRQLQSELQRAVDHAQSVVDEMAASPKQGLPLDDLQRQVAEAEQQHNEITSRIAITQSAYGSSICPACRRPFEGHDAETLERELQEMRAEQVTRETALNERRQRLAEALLYNRTVEENSKIFKQWQTYLEEKEQDLRTCVTELIPFPPVTQSQLDEARKTYEKTASYAATRKQTTKALEQANLDYQYAQRPVPAVTEVPVAYVKEQEHLHNAAVETHTAALTRKAVLEVKRDEVARQQKALAENDRKLTQRIREAAQAEERDQALTRLAKYLRTNRDRFMRAAWDGLLTYASVFVGNASDGAITELKRTSKGDFTYVEDGREMPLELASGMQLSILGVAIKLALMAAVGSRFDVLLLDEVSAAASDDNALRLTECLAETGQQIFLVSHREADAVAAQEVLTLS
jgi:DNA repair exonuclease SbcCD ATPase subunit